MVIISFAGRVTVDNQKAEWDSVLAGGELVSWTVTLSTWREMFFQLKFIAR